MWPEIKEDRIKSFHVLMGKTLCLEWIGMIGGKYAEDILTKATTPEGAEELAKEWIHFTEVSYTGGRASAIASIRGRAAMGLVYCQSPKGNEIVERMYEKCVKGEESGRMSSEMTSAMAYKAFIDEHDLQKRFELFGSDGSLQAIMKYIRKYQFR